MANPIVQLGLGSLEHADLFLDVVFVATAFSTGFTTIAVLGAVALILSITIQMMSAVLSVLATVQIGRNVYSSLVIVWFITSIQGMAWLAATCKTARFGAGDNVRDMGLGAARTFAVVVCEQVPQMLLAACYFRLVLEGMTLQARAKQWVSVSVTIFLMLTKTRKETIFYFVPCIIASILVIALMAPFELQDAHIIAI